MYLLHAPGGSEADRHKEILSYEEILRIAGVAALMGVGDPDNGRRTSYQKKCCTVL